MTSIPPSNLARPVADDPRPALPLVGDERTVLTAYLDWHRQTLEVKCRGLAGERLREKTVPPSGLTLQGLVRHLAGCERWWFRVQFAGERVPLLYYSDDDPEQDFDDLAEDFASSLEAWRAECARAREIVAAAPSLDRTGTHLASGGPISLRVVLVKMIAEYARHNGHADLLRERLDGVTGY